MEEKNIVNCISKLGEWKEMLYKHTSHTQDNTETAPHFARENYLTRDNLWKKVIMRNFLEREGH